MIKKSTKFRDKYGNEMEVVPQTTGNVAFFVENYKNMQFGKIFLNKRKVSKLRKVI
jgi:hypothetical protein